jgi:hypothetical protein
MVKLNHNAHQASTVLTTMAIPTPKSPRAIHPRKDAGRVKSQLSTTSCLSSDVVDVTGLEGEGFPSFSLF